MLSLERAQRDGCGEEWRVIPGWRRYSVSSVGRIRRDATGLIRAQAADSNGYPTVGLYQSGQNDRLRVHGLLMRAFVGPRKDGEQVNHIDGVKHHNWLWNLEYVTTAENNRHAFATGLNHVGERHGQSKLTEEAVRHIRASNKTATELATELGVASATVKDARRGTTWRHVS